VPALSTAIFVQVQAPHDDNGGANNEPGHSQLEAFITRLDRQRAHIELSLMDHTRPAQEQEQLEQTYDLLFELRQIAATSLAVVQRLERELAQ
jgi:hypothetical protein